MAWEKVEKVEEVTVGGCKALMVNGYELALFRVGEEFHCIDDVCPHLAAPLSDGWVENEIVTCPWHAWQINVRTGEVLFDPYSKVSTYPCKVESEAVWVQIPDKTT